VDPGARHLASTDWNSNYTDLREFSMGAGEGWDISSDHLAIECVGCEQRDIFKKLTIMNKVKISYRID
jgi:hypothetical protein